MLNFFQWFFFFFCLIECAWSVTSVVSDSLWPHGLYVAHQALLSMGFSRQGYWSGLACPPPGSLPDLGIQPMSFMSPALAGGFFTTSATWEAPWYDNVFSYLVYYYNEWHWLVSNCWTSLAFLERIPLGQTVSFCLYIARFDLLMFCGQHLHLYLWEILFCNVFVWFCYWDENFHPTFLSWYVGRLLIFPFCCYIQSLTWNFVSILITF